ncbi:MAG: phosphotransferase [Gammaproteobacteria bacterium]
MSDVRADGLVRWARMTDPDIPPDATLKPVSDDASFRRYFRFTGADVPYVYVDAPPAHEDNESFIRISAALAGAGLSCPVVDAADVSLG